MTTGQLAGGLRDDDFGHPREEESCSISRSTLSQPSCLSVTLQAFHVESEEAADGDQHELQHVPIAGLVIEKHGESMRNSQFMG